MSGLAVPQFAVGAPGGGGKIPVNPHYLLAYEEDGRATLRNYQGRIYEVRDPAGLPPASMPPPRLSGAVAAPAPAEAVPIVSTWLRHRP
jgi:hypothetical protein